MSKEGPRLNDVLDLGQGDDEYIRKILDGFGNIYNGYYHITAIDGDMLTTITKRYNQGIDFDSLVKEQLDRVDWETFEDVIDKLAIILIGGYCHKGDFFKAVQKFGETDDKTDADEDENRRTVKGYWIVNDDLMKCRICGHIEDTNPRWTYCPICGSKMDWARDSEKIGRASTIVSHSEWEEFHDNLSQCRQQLSDRSAMMDEVSE